MRAYVAALAALAVCHFVMLPLDGTTEPKAEELTFTPEFVISGIVFDSSMLALTEKNNVHIKDCLFLGNADRSKTEVAIRLVRCKNVFIEDCTFRQTHAGVYAVGGSNIAVTRCKAYNMNGGKDLAGVTLSRGQFVQFNGVSGGSVSYSLSVAERKKNFYEDHINLYRSGDIIVHHNTLLGHSESKSGCGIVLMDNFGTNQVACFNTLFMCGQVGIGVAGGNTSFVYKNTIVYPKAEDTLANVAIYAYNVRPEHELIANVMIRDNYINWFTFRKSKYVQNALYFPKKDGVTLVATSNQIISSLGEGETVDDYEKAYYVTELQEDVVHEVVPEVVVVEKVEPSLREYIQLLSEQVSRCGETLSKIKNHF